VTDSNGPVVGATVTYTGADQSTYAVPTDQNGYYFFGPMLAQDYTVTVTGANDDSQTSTVTVPAGSATLDFTLTATTPSPSPT
jgi:hypothetical protein